MPVIVMVDVFPSPLTTRFCFVSSFPPFFATRLVGVQDRLVSLQWGPAFGITHHRRVLAIEVVVV